MNELINNKKKSEILVEKLASMEYGDVILHKEIAEIIEEKYGSGKYRSTVSQARKILLKEYQKAIESIIREGYRIVQPDNFTQQSLKYYKRSFNEMQKGYDTLRYAPVGDMTIEGREIHRRVYDRAIILNASMKGASVELKELAGKRKHPLSPEFIRHD